MMQVNGVSFPEGSEDMLMRALQTQKHRHLDQLAKPRPAGTRAAAQKRVQRLDELSALLAYATGAADPTPKADRQRVPGGRRKPDRRRS
jgi:hypothetical protein